MLIPGSMRYDLSCLAQNVNVSNSRFLRLSWMLSGEVDKLLLRQWQGITAFEHVDKRAPPSSFAGAQTP